jgi:hypothetical protein
VPIVGAFFIDLSNSLVITIFTSLARCKDGTETAGVNERARLRRAQNPLRDLSGWHEKGMSKA